MCTILLLNTYGYNNMYQGISILIIGISSNYLFIFNIYFRSIFCNVMIK